MCIIASLPTASPTGHQARMQEEESVACSLHRIVKVDKLLIEVFAVSLAEA